MKRSLLTTVIILLMLSGHSQLNNSWIDYSKTYYKFKLAKDTFCRIFQPSLPAALANAPVQQFQLFRNGKEVRLFTSVASGPMGASDYLEFWGEMNDGKPDKPLYKNPDYQLSEKYSLESDTAVYYLTLNPSGPTLRYVQSPNPVATNTLPPDNYFMRRMEVNFKDQINRGLASVLGEYVYSASYDIGEGWASNAISPGGDLTVNLSGMNVYTSAPANSVMFTVGASGNGLYARDLIAKFYSTTILTDHSMPFFNYVKDTVRNISNSLLLSTNDLPVSIATNASDPNDRIVASNFSVTYPATFTFNNQKNFYFELAPNAAGNFLVINSFNFNGVVPVLYDITNGKRYLGDLGSPGQVRFALPADLASVRKFNLMSTDVPNIMNVTGLTTKTFTNYSVNTNQGNYIIISNPVLYNDGNGVNNVDLYRQYRSSAAGGSFNAKIYDVNELTEQFGFGIKKHPAGVRDFIRYAAQNFISPKYVFIIGRGMTYVDYTIYQANPAADQTNLVQTFGFPASDILLASEPGTILPLIPIGRLGAINGTEVGNYYRKMLEYEAAQQSPSQTIGDKAWMKNVLHTIGGSDSIETGDFLVYMNAYKRIVEDTLYGATVSTYAKSSVAAVDQQQSALISQLFQTGLSYVKYFGHSSSNELAINLNYPETYNNAGKYPFMHVSGCTVGNYYTYNPARLTGYPGMSLSEKYVLLDRKGSIGFLGSTHWGIPPFLNNYNTVLYNNFSNYMYGNTIGNQIKATIQALNSATDFYSRVNLEEINFHGDPALRLNNFNKPDYVIEDQLVKFTPNIISVADSNFKVNIKMLNIGRVVNDSMRVTVKQQLPDNSVRVLYNNIIPAIKYIDSINLIVRINPITDKGLNKLIVNLDDGNRIAELSETNNILVKDFYIFEDELSPIYPYKYSIVSLQNIPFYASTANALSSQRQYVMEIDTTELFNSPYKKTFNTSGTGGLIQFTPGNINFTDSTVYYWRTATVPTGSSSYIWNEFSFVYLPNSSAGFNQSHYFQHLNSITTDMFMGTDNKWKFDGHNASVKIKNGVFPTAANQAQDFAVVVDGSNQILSVCGIGNIIINVFSPFGMIPWQNAWPGTGLYGSDDVCGVERRFNFQYTITDRPKRKLAMDFLDMIPNGYYVTVRNTSYFNGLLNSYANDWKADTAFYGSGNSLYHRLKNAGFVDLDSFNRPRAFNFIYKKNDNGYTPAFNFSQGINDKIILDIVCPVSKTNGTITSPVFGPARSWTAFHWRGNSAETTPGDSISFNVVGVSPGGAETILFTVDSTVKDLNISSINAVQYPYLKLKMYNQDTVMGTPYQLRYWRLNYNAIPEGAVAPNLLFVMKDTASQGELVDFKLAFKNISQSNFDSLLKVNLIITDRNNVPHNINIPKRKALVSGDTLVISYQIDTRNYPGANTVFVDVNPNNDQPEQYHFNNILYKNLYVKADDFNPLLDVTFDGVHILNKDIVSAKPHILVNLKDESRYLALSDTSLIKVQVRFPDGTIHNYNFGDTMRFTPANLGSGTNTASIDFMPWFPQDGEYELIVSGKDVAGNPAGRLNYHVIFTVITKPMISNLLNYPNPFTSSTAFVFTVTGSEVPQNIRIQVLTITGKVVREITSNELGPIHIGRNITEFKWDGTDMYGAKLANGVYLYRVMTNLNGKSFDKFKADGDDTDKFFKNGYGKMVIIR